MITEQKGQIIVNELQPMSEAPMNGIRFLAKFKSELGLRQTRCTYGEQVEVSYGTTHRSNCEGWIPMPIYKPKKANE